MSTGGVGPSSDPYNNHVIYVNPRQYKRICIRREQRDKMLLKRGRPRPSYLPVATRPESNSSKRKRDGSESPHKIPPNVDPFSQAAYFYPPTRYAKSRESDRVSSKIRRFNDRNAAEFSNVAALIAGNGYNSNYTGSVIPGTAPHSHGSEYSPHKERVSYVEHNAAESTVPGRLVAHVGSYCGAHNAGAMDARATNDGRQSEAYGRIDSYPEIHARSVNRGYRFQQSSGTSDSYSSASSASSYSASYDGRPMSSGSTVVMPVHSYPAAAGSQGVISADSYAGSKLGQVTYSRGAYSAETYSGESCCSDGHWREDYGHGSDGVDYYVTNTNSCGNRASESCHNGRYSDGDNVEHGVGESADVATAGEMSCAYAQHVVAGAGAYPASGMSRGGAQPVLRGPMCSEYVYVAGADAKV
ncbi:hypothetical protein, conserved [Babesia bigemina]|uniref:Nuclear transcription factor Y subunit n=1 Tax=Babesia bigemina TaxID=5866 RepID=A0A061DDK4_BABBI|nr:hypothetical protein, conserved [Babesia bigemina]CDR96325.1 hypothetical protein, conserved [Babesia bigemina]|eukprot:XP_012768511.1 hypothetical protein, conserved [Babesia bigemina]